MAKSRQIQQDIEKNLSLVEEGHMNFQALFKKIQTTTSAQQKERLETELKREIKKLQKIREKLRSFESQDPRFKLKLNEARRKIEDLMELHKQTEKESKTKAFSKEGLIISSKTNPHEEEKEEMREMIKGLISNLQDKINIKESELASAKNARTRVSQSEEISKQIKGIQYHYDKLELVLRQIENDSFSIDMIWSLNDKMENFIKNEENSEIEQELEQCYRELNLPNKILQNFPALNDEEHDPKKNLAKKPEAKPIPVAAKAEPKPAEKGWNSKEAYVKIAGKPEKIVEDLPEEEIENEKVDQEHIKKMMDHAYVYPIRSAERAKSSLQIILNPYQGHQSYPKKPVFNNSYFKKYELDTLFFIFYHQQGTYQQYLAAKELKNKGWLYHKRFQSWFLRAGDPKLTAPDREKGSFTYFDYESTWNTRRKQDFEFEYSFLEND